MTVLCETELYLRADPEKKPVPCEHTAIWYVKTQGVYFPMLCCELHLKVALARGDRHVVRSIKTVKLRSEEVTA